MRPPCSAISRTNRLLMYPKRRRARHVHGADARHGVVVVGHLLLDLEVAGRPQTLDDEVGLDRRRGLHGEPGERDDRDPVAFRQARLGELDPVVDREQPRRLLGVVHDGDDDLPEQLQRLVDDVDVTVVERVETAGYQDLRHGSAKRTSVIARRRSPRCGRIASTG